ncbi:HYC_CC_PP family protein [Chitinophaga japonensis]|uniref:Uncharacterized protein n=1 Tax=Chitinophaga japonensis TaxID=104662 RepID=A0A562T0E3_CHIJA|nr:hypothetical protein [Chitinophaga japonensis]TWI86991.1 hypothetical protein LX66_4258 [Chitinophaga japonensis]
MKRLITLILTFIYMGTVTGAPVQLHYCMGKLVEWQLGSSEKERCGKCGMKKVPAGTGIAKKQCCEDQFKELKLKKDQRLPASASQLVFTPVALIPAYVSVMPAAPVTSLATAFPVTTGPPPAADVPVFLLHCNFRI